MRTHRTIPAAVAVAVAVAVAPASASEGTAVEDAVTVGHDEGHAGYDTVPSAADHAVTTGCSMIRTNKTLVKWSGHATAVGHAGANFTSVTCYLQVTGPGVAYTVARGATANGPSASFGQVAEFVAPDTSVSVCVYAASARWSDGHGAAYANQFCMNLN